MAKYYVLREFYAGGLDSIAAAKHTIIEMPEHRGKEFVEQGLLREIANIAPIEAKPIKPQETKPVKPSETKKDAHSKKK